MVTERRACDKIVKLLDDNNKLRSIDKSRRETPATLRKLEAMQSLLASTFQLWPTNVDTLVTNAEDLAFLQSMKGDRAASFGAFDKSLAKQIFRRQCRKAAALNHLKRSRIDIEATTATVSSELLADEECNTNFTEESESFSSSEDSGDIEAEDVNQVVQRNKPNGTVAFIPPDVLSRPNLVALATRLKMTPMQQAAFTQALIVESGGDLSMVAASYATADRSRRRIVGEIATNIQPPKLCTLHWDGKLTPTLENHRVTQERMTVVVGDASQLKLLGVPSYYKPSDKSCGEIIAELTMKLMTEWHCDDRIVNMTFDTTSSNMSINQ